MLLTLKYTPNAQHKCCAALIKGSNPAIWLQQISQWGIDVNQANYFIVPQSINSTAAAGLFVVFKNAEQVKNIEIIHPYGKIGDSLFLPTNALLYPEVTEADLKRVLLWTYQLYHPTIGLVGFEESDKINPAAWLNYERNINKKWSFAHKGLPSLPALTLIEVRSPTAAEVFEVVAKEINSKPLSGLADKYKQTAIAKLFNLFLEIVLKLIILLVGLIFALLAKIFSFIENSGGNYNTSNRTRPLLSTSSSSSFSSSYNPSSKKGVSFIEKLFKRIEEKIADLEERRKNELNKLLKMFDENSDEALKYALPLDSPYLNRGGGTDEGSWKLFRQNPFFNLRGLGGGAATSAWGIDGVQYQSLRDKYLAAAQREIERKEFKKAAYIYAHLLADFNSAANVLEQGKYYREAAALYKEHLKNKEAASQCLERGGLIIDAIELYKELERDEKVGDLYKQIEQHEKAETYYEKHIEKKLISTDYIDAARVAENKLENPERAKAILLEGWQGTVNYENCLKNYFDIEAKENNTLAAVKTLYSKNILATKKQNFLSVLEYVNKQYPGDELLYTSQTIAFEIVSQEALSNNPRAVAQLGSFFQDDNLLPSDSNRFLTRQPLQNVKKAKVKEIPLPGDTDWSKLISHRHQFLVFGLKDNELQMMRGNWYGDIELYFWSGKRENNQTPIVINNPLYTNKIIFVDIDPLSSKELPKNKYFSEELIVDWPAKIEARHSLITFNDSGELYRLEADGERETLHHFDKYYNLSRSVNCTYDDESFQIKPLDFSHSYAAVFYQEYIYGFNYKSLFSVSIAGKINNFPTEAGIRLIASHIYGEKVVFIVSTNKGCFAAEAKNGYITFFTDVYFHEVTPPQYIEILSKDIFVVARNTNIYVYEYNEGYPKQKWSFETKTSIKAIVKTTTQNQIALLSADNKIILMMIDE
ncbi:MAG: hypothetical protein ACO1PI_10505 [Bacteroidota bacterium]